MTRVPDLMLRRAGRAAVYVRVSPAAGAAKWLETSSENAWPSLALWDGKSVGEGKGVDLGGGRILKKKMTGKKGGVGGRGVEAKAVSGAGPVMNPEWRVMREAGRG